MDSSSILQNEVLYYLLEWCNTKTFQKELPCAFDHTMDLDFNWNIELFFHPNILKYEQWIGYSFHKLFCDGEILLLFDMIELKKEYFDFQVLIERTFEPCEKQQRKKMKKLSNNIAIKIKLP